MELTKHIPKEALPNIGNVVVSPGCELYMLNVAKELGVRDLGPIAPVLAKQVVSLVTGVYWTKSKWFREQKVHRISAFTITPDEGEKVQPRDVPVHLYHTPTGWAILAPEEHDIPENYFDLRLIEEVKVECFPECCS